MEPATDSTRTMTDFDDLADRFRINKGKKFRLRDVNPADTGKLKSPAKATALLQRSVEMLSEFQEKLYAQDRWSLLLVFQAMDAAGKDGTIKHVMSGVNPQGCEVTSFKTPSDLELDHDYLWRAERALPERGRIGIFNRSHYEEVLVVRVHPEYLGSQKLPPKLITKDAKFIGELEAFAEIDRLNIGPISTMAISWDQPHEGNMFEILWKRRSIERAW